MTSRHPVSTEIVHDLDAIEKTAPPRFQRFEAWLTRYSISLLRISLGLVILGFGVLKYFPGVSPAENLVKTTIHVMTFGLVPTMGRIAMVVTATLECFIGVSLIIRRGLRATIYLLFLWVLGILSPIVFLPHRLFTGPHHAPTLEGQYVLKDLILFAASLVIATTLYHTTSPAACQSTRPEHQSTGNEGQ
jgi:putative oxidoreductase